jgi:hypothetical protein
MDLRIGEPNVHARVIMRDASGNETQSYDVAGGVLWESTDDTKIAILDDDADPRDAVVSVLALTEEGSPVRLSVSFDGDSGSGVRTVRGESEDLNVVPGDATGAEITIEFRAAPAPPE